MKAVFAWLFSQNNSNLQIGLFDVWHFLYLFIIFGVCLVVYGTYYVLRTAFRKKLTV